MHRGYYRISELTDSILEKLETAGHPWEKSLTKQENPSFINKLKKKETSLTDKEPAKKRDHKGGATPDSSAGKIRVEK